MNFLGDVATWFADGDNWRGPFGVPNRLREHLWLSFLAMALAASVAIPIGVVLGHLRRFGTLAINVSNIGRAVPSFALLVFGFQLWPLDERAGVSIAALWTLVALAIPPMVTNAYVAVAEVPDDVRDAARGMGMNAWQVLLHAELPVALPLLLSGVRIAALQVVATAALAAVVASGGLGRFIVDGFATRDYTEVFAGALLVAVLALLVDGLLALLQRRVVSEGVRRRIDRPVA